MSDRPTPNNLDGRLTILLKSKVGTYAIRLLAGEARDEIRELKRQRDAAVEALRATPCPRLLLQEEHYNDSLVLENCLGCTCYRAALREIEEGKS